jgi:hypothetical protein
MPFSPSTTATHCPRSTCWNSLPSGLRYSLVYGIQVHKVEAVSQSKSGNVWIYSTVCTGYTWSPLTCSVSPETSFHSATAAPPCGRPSRTQQHLQYKYSISTVQCMGHSTPSSTCQPSGPHVDIAACACSVTPQVGSPHASLVKRPKNARGPHSPPVKV